MNIGKWHFGVYQGTPGVWDITKLTYCIDGPAHKALYPVECTAGTQIRVWDGDKLVATYHGTGRRIRSGAWEAIYLDPDLHIEAMVEEARYWARFW